MTVADIRCAYNDERSEFWSFAETLSTEDRSHPSLCAGWTVANLIDHVAAWERLLGFDHAIEYPRRAVSFSMEYLRARGSTDRVNERLLRSRPGDLQARPNRHLFDRVAAGSQLAELVVHHQDIRRPLGQPRAIPPDRLRLALDGLRRLPGIDLRKRTRGRQWQTTDIDWSIGTTGPVSRGQAEAVLLGLAGRTIPGDELTSDHEP